MTFPQSLRGLANAPRCNASSGWMVNFSGSFAQSGKLRVEPSDILSGFQSLGRFVVLALSIF